MPQVTRTPMTLERDYRDLTNRVTTSLTLLGNSADSPKPILRPWPTTGHDAEIVEI